MSWRVATNSAIVELRREREEDQQGGDQHCLTPRGGGICGSIHGRVREFNQGQPAEAEAAGNCRDHDSLRRTPSLGVSAGSK